MSDALPPASPTADSPDDLAVRLQAALGDGYEVERRLGEGGFAVVFLVKDVRLERKLAVKVLSPDVIASRAVLDRFQREAKTVAQLSHPNVVPLHFVGQQDDLVYLVMEAIGGGSLADKLERDGRLSFDDVSRVFSEVAAALSHAHRRGVIHRDIKPQNVLLDAESGRALVTDFGIARTDGGSTLTATGMVVGTPGYLAPEQVTGEAIDHRVDIYALGVMMYELLTGETPFPGPTPIAAMMRRLAGPPDPLRDKRPDVPPLIEALVERCLATNPGDRFADANEIVQALGGQVSATFPAVSAATVIGTRTAGARAASGTVAQATPSRRPVLVAAVAAVVLLAGSVAWWRTRADATERPAAENPAASARPAAVAPVDSDMVLIPAGRYRIGSDTGPKESQPAHDVSLAAFGIGRHEVTVGEYDAFVKVGRAPATWEPGTPPDVPVTGVVLAEAAGYCAWKYPAGGRLPTEEEWEAAARGPEGRMYPWGNTWDATAVRVSDAAGRPRSVGSFPRGRTAMGIDDLIGNVWEWTSSPFKSYRDSTATATDLYVIRGGAYNSLVQVATATFRGRARSAASRTDLAFTGFRCAMDARGEGAR